jgi:hypothetical protein
MGEISFFTIGLVEQEIIFDVILPIIASCDWSTGISNRGCSPTVELKNTSHPSMENPSQMCSRF